MRRSISSLAIALIACFALTGVAAAQPISEPASCAGYLAAWANPNNGWIIQNLVMPAAADLGLTVGEYTAIIAAQHEGSLDACIPA